jgi:hypothetical protein
MRVRVHLDGAREPEIAGELEAGFSLPAPQLFFAGRSDGYASFEGKLDDVAVYSRPLTPGEIAAQFKASSLSACDY